MDLDELAFHPWTVQGPRDVHRALVGAQLRLVDCVVHDGPSHSRKTGRAERHLRAGWLRRRRTECDTVTGQGLHEPLHPLVRRQVGKTIHSLRGDHLTVVVGEVRRWLVQRQTRDPWTVFGDVSECDRGADREAVQVDRS
jgi:hypothetical protein